MAQRAADLMKGPPITVVPETPVLEVQHLLVQANIGGVPVVDAGGVVRGLITRTDLLRVMDQASDEDIDALEPGAPETLTAIDIATPSPIWVTPETPIVEVARVMRQEAIHRVLVGRDGRLAGVLSAFDLLEAVR